MIPVVNVLFKLKDTNHPMAKAAKTRQEKPLKLSPKALEKALADSALQARRLADAFGQKVPYVSVKPEPPQRKA